jgi:hypothetical protein
MNRVEEQAISCPYCGESIDLLIDCSVDFQEYIEDCQVCCRPINMRISVDGEGDVQVNARHQDEA